MRKIILTLILAVIAVPAMAQDHEGWLKPVKAQFVCMVNNQSHGTPQIAVEVEGKTYYGCCPMCKAKLEKSSAIRTAIDPVSGNHVDKAEAVMGTGPDRTVYYFESEENLHSYASSSVGGMKSMMREEGVHP
tara:strand:- start:4547 stop:4942 length:396 start_codon:yes stop_codon:yes gene_type:complete